MQEPNAQTLSGASQRSNARGPQAATQKCSTSMSPRKSALQEHVPLNSVASPRLCSGKQIAPMRMCFHWDSQNVSNTACEARDGCCTKLGSCTAIRYTASRVPKPGAIVAGVLDHISEPNLWACCLVNPGTSAGKQHARLPNRCAQLSQTTAKL